jgi:hypothetical protein
MELNLYFIKCYLNYYNFLKFKILHWKLFRINRKEKATTHMGQIWPTQPTPSQLSRGGSPPNRGAGEPRRAAALAESGGLSATRRVEVAARVGRQCGRMILGLREDRARQRELTTVTAVGRRSFVGERCGGALVSEDGEVGKVSQGMVVLGEAKMRPKMGHRGLAPGRSSRSRKAVGVGSLWRLLMILLRGSRTGTPSDDGSTRSWL